MRPFHPFRGKALAIYTFTLAAFLFITSILAAAPDEARKVFDSLFAAKIKAAVASADRADDLAVAREMVDLARKSADQPALVALLCEATHDLATRHADSYAVGVEALQFLADTVDDKHAAAREKLVTLLTRQSTAGRADERELAGEMLVELLVSMGDERLEKKQYTEAVGDFRRAVTVATQKKSGLLDEAKAKLEWAQAGDRATKQLARLQEKLLKDADTATAEEIVKLCLIELDDPAAAAPFLDRVKDNDLKAVAPLAAKASDQLNESECQKLGEWYRAAAATQPAGAAASAGGGNPIPWRRAEYYLHRFTALHTQRDLALTKAEGQLKEAREKLKALHPPERTKKFARGTQLAEDAHNGFTGNVTQANIYSLTATDEVEIARTALRVKGAGVRGPDTHGDVFIRIGAGQWTKVGAWTKASCTRAQANDNWQDFSLAAVPGRVRTKQIEVRLQYTSGAEQFDISSVRWVVR